MYLLGWIRWTHYDGSYGSNNGFDGVFIKGDEVIINESKQWTSGGVTLTGLNLQTGWPAQMTEDWVRAVTEKLREEGKDILADKIIFALNNNKLTKIVTFVDRTTPGNAGDLIGGLNIIKVN